MVIYVPCLFLIPRNLCNPIVPSGLSLTTAKNGAWSYGTSKKDAFPCDLAAGVGRMLHCTRDFRHLCASTTGRNRAVDAVVWAHLRLAFFVAAPLSSVGF